MPKTIQTKMRLLSLIMAVMLMCPAAYAQMPNDAIYMPAKTACLALSYNHSSWDKYWENKLKRDNLNIGKQTTQAAMAMLAVGVTKNLNVIVGLPYIWTKTSAGNLQWHNGFQDVSGWLKYRFLNKSGLSLHAVVGGSIPATNYVPDFMPMSIGLQCKTATARLVVRYKHTSGVYLTAYSSYIFRSKINIDRDSYLMYEKLYNTNEVSVPDAYDASARIGYTNKMLQTEVFAEHGACADGDYIRRNQMPFPTNNMKSTAVGWYGKFQPKNIGFNARVSYVVDGENVGQAISYQAGILYQFAYLKSGKK
jgi:hypothetical protein